MTRKFKQAEKDYILSQLIERGAELFRQFGFRKTTITDITKEVGIAQGTFYQFFNSKELLYFAILEKEEKRLKGQFFTVPQSDENPKEWVKQTIKEFIEEVETNPLIRELFIGETMKILIRKIPPKQLEEHFLKDTSMLKSWIQSLHDAGLQLTITPEVMAGLFRGLFIQSLHRNEIGEDVYDETINIQIDLFVNHLFLEKG